MGRGRLRRVVMPALAVLAIALAIWWLEYRPQGGEGPQVGAYGPVDLPPALVPPGMEVGPEEGKLAPDFLLPTLKGEVRLSDLRGKALLVNFWATWCGPCRKEMPQLVAAYERYRQEGLEIVAVNLQEPEDRVRRFMEEFGARFTVALDKTGAVVREYQLLGIPTTFFIDRQGVIRSIFRGPFLGEAQGQGIQEAIGAQELEERIRQILD